MPTYRKCQDFCYNFQMDDFPFLTTAISNVITKLRENAGLSKRKLSQISGIDRVYILQVEQGKYRPTVNFMFLLARGLDMPPQELFALISDEQARLEKPKNQT